jgi:MFS family permease
VTDTRAAAGASPPGIGDKAAIAGILAMVAANQTGTGILNAVIPVQLAADGHPAAAAGLVSTVFSITFLIGCLLGPAIVRKFGPGPTLIGIGVLNAVLALMHWALPGPLAWAAIRGVGGLATATYFILIETWLSSVASASGRGVVFGAYMVAIRTAFAIGQVAIAFVAPDQVVHLLLLAAAVYIAAPWLRPGADPSVMPTMASPSLAMMLALPRRAPASASVALCHGLVFAVVPALLPKWGLDTGIDVARVGAALAAIQVGGLLLQMPASLASDRFERRTVMAAMTLITALASLGVLLSGVTGGLAWIVLMLL